MRDQDPETHDPVARLRGFIEDGGYADGDRLPPERASVGRAGPVARDTAQGARRAGAGRA